MIYFTLLLLEFKHRKCFEGIKSMLFEQGVQTVLKGLRDGHVSLMRSGC
jgi:hypothetical protein